MQRNKFILHHTANILHNTKINNYEKKHAIYPFIIWKTYALCSLISIAIFRVCL